MFVLYRVGGKESTLILPEFRSINTGTLDNLYLHNSDWNFLKQNIMNSLSNDLYLVILSYLGDFDQREWCGCNKKWYNELLRGHVRKLRILFQYRNYQKSMENVMTRLDRVIKRPSKQLEISIQEYTHYSRLLPDIEILLERIEFSVKKFELAGEDLLCLFSRRAGKTVHINHLDLTDLAETSEESLSEAFNKISSLEKLTVTAINYHSSLPHVKTVKELLIENARFPQSIHPLYLTHLQKLKLISCGVSDVSLLGQIPDLSLEYCRNITDISALKNNRKIEVSYCNGIDDYSKSFENSEIINLFLASHSAYVTFHQCKKVKSLYFSCNVPVLLEVLSIPTTAISFDVTGSMTYNVDLHITPFHRLQQLTIAEIESITSLEGLCLDRLVIIKLYRLPFLSSLDGLGLGRNKKVIVSYCHLIKDYSSLRYVHEVEIHTKHEVTLDELDHVYSLDIKAERLVVDSTKSYDHIYSFISDVTNPFEFRGLERIPYLAVHPYQLVRIARFLGEGGELLTQRLNIQARHGYLQHEVEGHIRPFYRRYFQKDFHFFDHPRPNSQKGISYVSFLRRSHGEH